MIKGHIALFTFVNEKAN